MKRLNIVLSQWQALQVPCFIRFNSFFLLPCFLFLRFSCILSTRCCSDLPFLIPFLQWLGWITLTLIADRHFESLSALPLKTPAVGKRRALAIQFYFWVVGAWLALRPLIVFHEKWSVNKVGPQSLSLELLCICRTAGRCVRSRVCFDFYQEAILGLLSGPCSDQSYWHECFNIPWCMIDQLQKVSSLYLFGGIKPYGQGYFWLLSGAPLNKITGIAVMCFSAVFAVISNKFYLCTFSAK